MWLDCLTFCDGGFQSVCPLMEKDKRLMNAFWWGKLTEGDTVSCSDGRGHAQLVFNPIFCWWVELCSLPVIYLGPNCGGGNEDNGDLPQKTPGITAIVSAPIPAAGHLWPPHSQETPSTHRQGPCGVTVPFSWVLMHKVLLCPPRVYFPVLCKFWQLCSGVNGHHLQ